MKKTFLFLFALVATKRPLGRLSFVFACVMLWSLSLKAQTFVSTEPSNKNAILEMYTGINSPYDPDGHRRANEACSARPGHAWTINIHQGGFAANTYTTPWGDALAEQSGLEAYPTGTVNRHVFVGSQTILGRNQFASSVNTICNQASPVNVAARVLLDSITRVMTITVEAYYTANSNAATNMLNIAILQDSILGPQADYGNYNPSQVVGSQYRHMHMLRDLVTGQWGDTIATTTQGTFFTKEYTYTVLNKISNEDMILKDLRVIVFIAEGKQEIITGCEGEIEWGMNTMTPSIIDMKYTTTNDCEVGFVPTITVLNSTYDTVRNAEFTYVINGTTDVYEWTGTMLPGASTEIQLPSLSDELEGGVTYTLEVTPTSIDGEVVEGKTNTLEMIKYLYTAEGPLHFVLGTDAYASETTFKFMKPDGTVIAHGGPWQDRDQANVIEHRYTISPAEAGCYILEVYDAFGDGINAGYGEGFFSLENADGLIFRDNGQFGEKATYYIRVTNDGDGSISRSCIVTINSNGGGNVYGAGTYNLGDTVTLYAEPYEGYRFTGWSDGVTDNPRTIIISDDITFTANFEEILYLVDVYVNNSQYGYVYFMTEWGDTYSPNDFNGNPVYGEGLVLTYYAVPNDRYQFLGWSNGVTDNPYTFQVMGDTTFTAIFGLYPPEITVVANDSTKGQALGSGIYDMFTTISIQAVPNENAMFVCWQDGNAENPREIEAIEDATYMAIFANRYADTITLYDTTIVVDSIPYEVFVHDTTYIDVFIHDTTIVTVHDTIMEQLTYYTLTVQSSNATRGLVAGNGSFPVGTEVEIAAIPVEGNHFVKWNDDNTENPRRITLTENATYVATFEPNATQGVADVMLNGYSVSAREGMIVVKDAEGEQLRVFDAAGRLLHQGRVESEEWHVGVKSAGAYFVQVGGGVAQKVVVVK